MWEGQRELKKENLTFWRLSGVTWIPLVASRALVVAFVLSFGLPGPLPGALFPLVVSMAALLHSFGVPVVPLWPQSLTL